MGIQTAKSIIAVVAVFALSACVKERVIEKTVAEDKITQKNSQELLKYSKNSNTLVLQKESLGKAFLLSPSFYSTGQSPMPNFVKPMIVGFERYGQRMALYNYTDEQMYDSIAADKLLQSFDIVQEDDSTITIDFKEGFKSFNLTESLMIVMKEVLEAIKENSKNSNESAIEIKDSIVKNISYQGRSLYINQIIRTTDRQMASIPNPENPSVNAQYMKITETTREYTFELKPYEVNKSFKSKNFDKSMRIGYFINLKFGKGEDEPIPQIAKWDIAEERGPIEVRFADSVPHDIVPTLEEGLQYWNRTFGRTVLKRGKDFSKGDNQDARSIFVYWVPWDSAGFAVAGIQADPLTGEILKGSVFLTSSWKASTQAGVSLQVNNRVDDAAAFKNATCFLEQAKMTESSNLNSSANDNVIKKAVNDTMRIIFSHEMGHALGLRHNFVGSHANSYSDEEVQDAGKNYLKGIENKIPVSTTVMDYTSGLFTAMQGAYIKTNTLPYDLDAIGWGYFNQEPKLPKYNYCSDEHIMYANKDAGKSVYGCERFDSYKNVFKSTIETLVVDQSQKMVKVIEKLERAKVESNSKYGTEFSFESFLNSISFEYNYIVNPFSSIMYDEATTKFISLETIVDYSLTALNAYGTQIYDPKIKEKIKNDLTEIGGYAGIIKSLMDLQEKAKGQFNQKQIKAYFDSEKVNNLRRHLTDEQVAQVKEKLMTAAKNADENYFVIVLNAFTLKNYNEKTINLDFPMGDLAYLTPLFGKLYEKVIFSSSINVTINGEMLSMPINQGFGNSNLEVVRLFFKSNTTDAATVNVMNKEKERLKLLAVFKTVEILKRLLGNNNFAKDSATLSSLLESADLSKVKGVFKFQLEEEIDELRKWEQMY